MMELSIRIIIFLHFQVLEPVRKIAWNAQMHKIARGDARRLRPSGDGRVYRAVGLRSTWFSGRRPISRPKIKNFP